MTTMKNSKGASTVDSTKERINKIEDKSFEII